MVYSHYKKIITGAIILILIGGFAYVLYPEIKKISSPVTYLVKSAEDVKNEFFSSPLISNENNADASLTASGVIDLTNTERAKQKLPPLTVNQKLTNAAQAKIEDMFEQQYFDHISPQGHGPGYLADQAGYSYVIVGENLALGNFKDDAVLVAAWMASPGHRANILHTRFTEIGVAVGQSIYKGKLVWLAVQEFGTPLSTCPSIDQSLKNHIDSDKGATDAMNKNLESLQSQIHSMLQNTPATQQAYNDKVHEYNDLVVTYDAMLAKLKNEIATYNKQVVSFNACIKT